MKTSLHVLCLSLLAFGAAAAQAQSAVTLYGITAMEAVHVTGYSVDGITAGSVNRLDSSQVSASRLGFRGTEDLGGGLSAVFDLTSGFSLDTGLPANASKFFNRGSLVGLQGDFGRVTAGRLWSVNDDIMSRYFIFGGYAAFRFTEFAGISDLTDNALKYVSPSYNGFTVRTLYGWGEGQTGRTFEVAANYANKYPFEAGLSYRSVRNLAGKADTLSTLGASYDLGKVRIHGGISYSNPEAQGTPKTRAYDIGAVWLVHPQGNLTLDYVARDQQGTRDDSAFLRLGGEYYLSKRTSVIANLVALKNKGDARQRFYGVGAPGVDQNVVSLGLRHAF
ncbi:MAG: hypothetical protein JWQ03_1806 [Variovorax sp.]|nr:hypothetical protein [Variovorax sp.]